MPAELVLAAITLGAFVSWVVAFVSALRMAARRAPGVTLGHLALNGFAFFDEKNFLPEAASDARRMRRAFTSFFAFVLLGMVLGVLLAPKSAFGGRAP